MKFLRFRRIVVSILVVVMLINCILPTFVSRVYADLIVEDSSIIEFAKQAKWSEKLKYTDEYGQTRYVIVGIIPAGLGFSPDEDDNITYQGRANKLGIDIYVGDPNVSSSYSSMIGSTMGIYGVDKANDHLFPPELKDVLLGMNANDDDRVVYFDVDEDFDMSNGYNIRIYDEADVGTGSTPISINPNDTDEARVNTSGDVSIIKKEDDEETAGFLERIIALFIASTGLGYYGLLQMIMGKGASIETLIFNQFDNTKLTLFDSMGDANTYITEMRGILNDFFSIGTKIAIICYMIILVYMGIRIFLNAGAQRKAQYNQLFMYWVQGVAILFLFPYVIKYTILVNDTFVEYVYESKNNMSFYGDFKQPETSGSNGDIAKIQDDMTSIGEELKNENQRQDYLAIVYRKAFNLGWLTYAICWVVIIKQWISLLIVYFKRLITVIFLVAIFPFVTISYAIDKIGDGKSQAFNNWYKEFALNVFLQSFHVVVYVIGMSIITMASEVSHSNPNENWLLILIVLSFLSTGEEMLRGIFNMKGGGGDTVKGIGATMLAAKGAKDLVKGTRQAIANRFGEGSSLNKAGQYIGKAKMDALDRALASSKNKGNAMQDTVNKMQMDDLNAKLAAPELQIDYAKEIETALSLNGSTATKEEQDKSLKLLYDALHSDNQKVREDTEKALANYFTSMNRSGKGGNEMAMEFDRKMEAIATASLVASGTLVPVQLNENISVLLDFHKRRKISAEQIKNITGLSVSELEAMKGPKVKMDATPKATARRETFSGGTKAPSKNGNRYAGVFTEGETKAERLKKYKEETSTLYTNYRENKKTLKKAEKNLEMAREGLLNATTSEELERAKKNEKHFSEVVMNARAEQQSIVKTMKQKNESLRDRKIKLYGPVSAAKSSYRQAKMERDMAHDNERAMKNERLAKGTTKIRRLSVRKQQETLQKQEEKDREEMRTTGRIKNPSVTRQISESLREKNQMADNTTELLYSYSRESALTEELTNDAKVVSNQRLGSRISERFAGYRMNKEASREGITEHRQFDDISDSISAETRKIGDDVIQYARNHHMLSSQNEVGPVVENRREKTVLTGVMDTSYNPYKDMPLTQKIDAVQQLADRINESRVNDVYTLQECYGFVTEYRDIRKNAKSERERQQIDEVFKAKGIDIGHYAAVTGELVLENPEAIDLTTAEGLRMLNEARVDAAGSYLGNEVLESDIFRTIRDLTQQKREVSAQRRRIESDTKANEKQIETAKKALWKDAKGFGKSALGAYVDMKALPYELAVGITSAGIGSGTPGGSIIAGSIAGTEANKVYFNTKKGIINAGTTAGKMANETRKRLNANSAKSGSSNGNSNTNSNSNASGNRKTKKGNDFQVNSIFDRMKKS